MKQKKNDDNREEKEEAADRMELGRLGAAAGAARAAVSGGVVLMVGQGVGRESRGGEQGRETGSE